MRFQRSVVLIPAVRNQPSRTSVAWATLPAGSLLTALDAFYLDPRRFGELEAGVEGEIVWIACDCGATIVRRGAGDDISCFVNQR